MELFMFARFHARAMGVSEALQKVVASSREEIGCINIHAFRSIRDPLLFYIHSRWTDDAAFETHATLPHTGRFIERVEPLIDHALEAQRCEIIV